MPRGAADQAQDTYKAAGTTADAGTAIANTAGNNSAALYSKLFPAYSAEAVGAPTAGTTAENTAVQQSVGGANAGAVSQGNLDAARTRNAGGFQPAEDEAVRSGGRDLSNASLAIKANEVDQGQKGLERLYGQNENQQIAGEGVNLGALGAENQATNARTAASPGWFQNFTSLLNAVKGAGGSSSSGSSFTV